MVPVECCETMLKVTLQTAVIYKRFLCKHFTYHSHAEKLLYFVQARKDFSKRRLRRRWKISQMLYKAIFGGRVLNERERSYNPVVNVSL